MTINPQDVSLIHKMAELARTSPKAWSELMAEFKVFTDRGKEQLLQTPNPELQRVTGRIFERSFILWMIENCIKESDKLGRK